MGRKRIVATVLAATAIVLIGLTGTVAAAPVYGDMLTCEKGCTAGLSTLRDCIQCCEDTWTPCFDECGKYRGDHPRTMECFRKCENSKLLINCPGWVNPDQPCPFTCQEWNPLEQECMGPPSNSCPKGGGRPE